MRRRWWTCGLAAAIAAALLSAAQAGAITGLPVPPLPKYFTWGVAGSAFQDEGGFTDSNWDVYNQQQGFRQDPYGTSVDFRHRYRSDIALAKKVGITQFRFGVNWARVEPREGQWSQQELAYYDDLFQAILDAGMVPQPTIDHWVYPKWVYDQGAWNNEKTVRDWLRFAEKLADRWKGKGARWLTFNEASFYLIEEQTYRPTTNLAAMLQHLVEAHRAFYDYAHKIDPAAQVSSNFVWVSDAVPLKRLSDLFLDDVRDKLDFIGFDYYFESVGDAGLANILLGRQPDTPQYPQGLYVALHDLAARFPGKPIYVVENGMPTDNGKPRADGWTRSRALSDSVYWVQRAWADGIDVRGYQYWSLTDNFEWGSYSPRYGLYTVDVLTDPTLTRKPTDAVATYTAITRRRGTPEGYQPTLIRCSDSGRALTCPDAPDQPQVRWAQAEPTAAHALKVKAAPALKVTLYVRRSGGRVRLTATVRASGVARVALSLRGAARTVTRRTVRVRAGRATATFVVRRAGSYQVTASAMGLRARSQIVRVRAA